MQFSVLRYCRDASTHPRTCQDKFHLPFLSLAVYFSLKEVKSLAAAFKGKEMETVDEIMTTLDADKSGDIDINEWCTRVQMFQRLFI